MKKRNGREDRRKRRTRATRRRARKTVIIRVLDDDGKATPEFLAWADAMLRRG
jgi:hypothetical protein